MDAHNDLNSGSMQEAKDRPSLVFFKDFFFPPSWKFILLNHPIFKKKNFHTWLVRWAHGPRLSSSTFWQMRFGKCALALLKINHSDKAKREILNPGIWVLTQNPSHQFITVCIHSWLLFQLSLQRGTFQLGKSKNAPHETLPPEYHHSTKDLKSHCSDEEWVKKYPLSAFWSSLMYYYNNKSNTFSASDHVVILLSFWCDGMSNEWVIWSVKCLTLVNKK